MLQAVMPAPGKIELRDIPAPEKPGPNNVLLRIQRIGVCGSDIHVFHGEHPLVNYPVIQGHEFSAIIESVGSNVKALKPGMRVTATPQIVCGQCAQCRSGREHICDALKVQGFQAPGCAQALWETAASSVVPLPDEMDFDAAALIEPLAVGVHAVRRVPNFVGRRVLVLGAGPIGNLLAQSAQAMGAARVAVADVNAHRLDIARSCGISHCLNTGEVPFDVAIRSTFGDVGYDVVFDCAGVQAALSSALAGLQKGGIYVVVAVYAKAPQIDLTLLQDRELNLLGAMMYQKPDYEAAIENLMQGKIKVAPLISKHFALAEYAQAYDYAITQKDRVMKVLINVAD